MQKWNKQGVYLLTVKEGADCISFLHSDYANEKVLFLIECKEFKNGGIDKRMLRDSEKGIPFLRQSKDYRFTE